MMINPALMTDEEFDAWQRELRLVLQTRVAAVYAYAREHTASKHAQAVAAAYSLYERTTRTLDGTELDEMRAIEALYRRATP